MKSLQNTIKTLLLILVVGSNAVYAQSIWEPQTNITGYVSTEFNYFDDLDGYNYNYGASVSEAGLLISYRATSAFTLKGVFVYRPDYEFDKMLNEAYGQYAVSSALNIKIGRFLTPLSPMNTYYYAPVNTSATLPMIVTNNENFPLNVDGISLNGFFGDTFKIKYDAFAGGYTNSTWKKSGAMGFFGREVPYFKNQINSRNTIDDSYSGTYNVGLGGKIGLSYKTIAEIGAGYFAPKKEKVPISVSLPENALYPGSPATAIVAPTGFERPAWGLNGKVQLRNTTIDAEYWTGNLKNDAIKFDFTGDGNKTLLSEGGDVELEGLFVQASQRIKKFTPYARYEYQHTNDVEYQRYSAGLNYKPSFERTLKLEYMLYKHDDSDTSINGLVVAYIFSF
ncbi:hypothetical protein [Gracilimonas mengyeensis]|uniref:Beta-barrel porin-2, OmpL-like. bbp2 n=1 Tax=Gracilimonas mengyeensis TaxID=1302730 RepID=A0A521AZ44_9BACT|nr:hypothetical protein [Gracilimonas mengyeensis]SMO40031.1 hypothetical protein SAMN06265219_101465 [Gracilimonas mengyeensis]